MNGLNYFLRRIDSDVLNKKFIAALNKCSERYNSIKENYPQSLTWFKNFVTATLIMSVERMTKLEDEVEENKIQDSSMDYYADEIEERWNELQEFGIRESITRILREEAKSKKSKKVKCSKCGWSWKLSEGGHDPYTCHKCGNINSKSELTEKCWAGYTQKGMKTMFGKRYPNCVKKKKK
jgi:predicted RNA-binding Zn-ribbon protein involved in translation (DUF1610 family)